VLMRQAKSPLPILHIKHLYETLSLSFVSLSHTGIVN
jgi:hypothetical protein